MMKKEYSSYKKTDNDWVGKIPSHWQISKLKFEIHALESGQRELVDNSEILSIGGEHIGSNGSLKLTNLKYVSEDFYNRNTRGRVQKGDILVVKDGATIGKSIYIENTPAKKMLLNEHVYRIVANKYIFYFILSHFFQKKIRAENTSAAQEGLNQQTIKNLPIFVPPAEEQEEIVSYLDFETHKIDSMINSQKKIVRLLKEKRDSEIDYFISKGLDNAELVDSGIDWLGKIPRHWKLMRAKYIFAEQSRPVREEDGIVTVFRDGQVCLRSKRREDGFTMAVLEQGYQGIRKGDLVIHSMDAFAGAIGVSEDDGRATPEYVVVKPYNEKIECSYYSHILRMMAKRNYILVLCPSVRERAPRFRYSKFKEVVLPLPPVEEQSRISSFLATKTNYYNEMISLAEKQVFLLEEKKEALITSTVFGKVDVREWQNFKRDLIPISKKCEEIGKS